jgi:quercetin dioxygenase-like cupin family protein
MAIVRLYTGEDGESHFEELDPASHPALASLQPTQGNIVFRTFEPGYFSDWHGAPRRQLVFTLSGEMEIGLGDGTSRRFGPGDILWAEDLTGRGHTYRITSDEPRLSVAVPI